MTTDHKRQVKQVPLSDIVDNPFQPRKAFDPASIQSLADEMHAGGGFWGSLQGRRRKDGKVEIVFGHRRLRSLQLLNVPTVPIEFVDLTDAGMAWRSLEENMQREGLTDLDKADAVRQLVELETAERETAGKPTRGVLTEVAKRLGLSHSYVSDLCEISVGIPTKQRASIQAGKITALTALEAKRWGGSAYLETLAQQGKRARTDPDVAKPTHLTVQAMKKAVAAAPEPVREKLKALIVAGEIVTPYKAEQRTRQLAAVHTRREKAPPPDLRVVIVGWTSRLKDWEKDMRDVVPYMDYVDEVPAIAGPFRRELQKLIDAATQLLATPTTRRTT